jgi:hypothetical protein
MDTVGYIKGLKFAFSKNSKECNILNVLYNFGYEYTLSLFKRKLIYLDLPEISDVLLHSYGFKSHLTKNHAKMNYKNGNRPLHTLNKSNGHVKLCYKKKKYNEISDFINANNFSIFNFRGRSKIDTSIIKLQQMFRKTFKKKKEAADKIKRLFRSILNKKYRKIIFQFDITEDTITCNKLERYCYYIIPDFEYDVRISFEI